MPSGLSGVNAFFSAVKAIYGTTDINTAISAAYDAHYLGYKLGAGSGTTLGQAAQKMYAPKGIFGGIGTGSAFWEGVGVAGNFVSTPNAAANQITGDIELTAQISPTALNVDQNLINKSAPSGTTMAYNFFLNATGGLSFAFSPTGALGSRTTVTSTATLASAGLSANTIFWVRITRNATSGVIQFFTSLNGTTFTQLGTTISSITGNLFASTEPLNIGTWANALHFYTGRIYRATIANSIGGTPVVDFNANQYTGANTWTSTTSEVWTVNSTGAGLADVVQTTAASQPLLLAHTGENYWFGSGVSGNFVGTASTASIASTKLDIKCQVLGGNALISKTIFSQDGASGENRIFSVEFADQATGTIRFFYNPSFSGSQVSSAGVGAIANYNGYIRVTYDSNGTNADITFYSSTNGTSWTLLSTHNVVSARLGNGSGVIQVGANNGGNVYVGKIGRCTASNSIGGTPVVDFNPASYNAATSQTQWTSATGEVWSLNVGTATTGYKGVLVDRTITQSDGIDDGLQAASLPTLNTQTFSVYLAHRALFANGSILELSNNYNLNPRTFNVGITSVRGIELGTRESNYNVYNTPSNTNFKLFSSRNNNALTPGTSEIDMYYNNIIQTKTTVVSTDQTFTFNTNYPLNILARNGGGSSSPSNSILTTAILTKTYDTTELTGMYNYLRSINNNAF